MPVLDRKELEESPLSDLHAIASELGIEGYRRLRRDDLIDALAGDGGAKPKPKPRTRTRVKKTEDKPAAAESRKESDDDAGDEDDDEQPRSRSRSRSRRGRVALRPGTTDRRGQRIRMTTPRTTRPTRSPARACSTFSRTAAASCARIRSRTRVRTSTSRPPRSAAASFARATRSRARCARRAGMSATRRSCAWT